MKRGHFGLEKGDKNAQGQHVSRIACAPGAFGGRRVGHVHRRVRHRDHCGRRVRAILYTVVTGDSIVNALTNIIARALNTKT
ncbi:hypothetical protein I553_2996 [Mycobacterium xenopi 4042]|uniref:Uncharacterized protein n=1 Tax=Mycobacterium xenopi 4042 TaxID=1299334 RepID=X8EFT2_MYCXE|nr:hypothetical protein I553_2996 [Mycobacterium xenopi 4042]